MRILYKTDHGASLDGKPAIKITGWYLDHNYRRVEETRYIGRYSCIDALGEVKTKIAEQLARGDGYSDASRAIMYRRGEDRWA